MYVPLSTQNMQASENIIRVNYFLPKIPHFKLGQAEQYVFFLFEYIVSIPRPHKILQPLFINIYEYVVVVESRKAPKQRNSKLPPLKNKGQQKRKVFSPVLSLEPPVSFHNYGEKIKVE